jgi:hypothetical protein
MKWTSPTTAVSTVVGSSHSMRTFRCTHWALFRGPSHPAGPRQGSRTWLSARRCERPGRWNDPYHRSCLVALRDAGSRKSSRVAAPSCRELRAPKSGGRVMFGRCQSGLDHRSEPIGGANDER